MGMKSLHKFKIPLIPTGHLPLTIFLFFLHVRTTATAVVNNTDC